MLAAVAALALGVVCLRFAHQRNALLMIIGLASMIGSLLLTTPFAIRAVTARSTKLPVTGRLAWRELGRNQSRSAAALATVTIAVGISAAAVVITAANTNPPTAGNLSDRQVVISATDARDPTVIPRRTASQTTALDNAAAQVAATMPSAALIPLSIAVDPTAPPSAQAQESGGLDAAQAVRRTGRQITSSYPLYVATPQLLAALDFNAHEPRPNGYYAVDPSGSWSLLNSQRERVPTPTALHARSYTSLPQVLVSPAVVAVHHWTTVRAGWLIQTPQALTPEQLRAARTRAAAVGLAIETRDPQTYLGRLRLAFTIGGIAITLAVIAIALVLLRIQTAADQRVLAAVGAPRRARRKIAATTAVVLAALGAVLGIVGAYVTLILAYSDTLNRLGNIPWTALTTIGLGIPVLAFATAWLTAGRQPSSINRPAIE